MKTETRLVEVIVNDWRSWCSHVDSVCGKVGRKIGALLRSFRLLDPFARRLYYQSIIQPYLEYATSLIIPSMSATQRNRLLAVWRKAIRATAGGNWQDDVSPLVEQLRLSVISHRWALQLAITIWRCKNNYAPSALREQLHQVSHRYGTLGQRNALVPLCLASSSCAGSFSKRAPLLWNALPNDLRVSSTISSFNVKFLDLLKVSDSRFLRLVFGKVDL